MKLLHAADLHLDTPFTGRSDAEVRYLKKALLQVPQTIANLCRERGCELLLLSGDVFDGAATQDSIDALHNALAFAAVPTFIAPGNHDFCAPDSPWLTHRWPENVHIFTAPHMESVTVPELDCRVYGAGFQSMDCGALLSGFRADGAERYHIAVLHGDPLQRNSPYNPISQLQIADSGLHYLALGHIHKADAFTAGETLCAWPGCPMGRGNDETGEKGVYLVSLEEMAAAEFIPLPTPRFYDLEAEVDGDPTEAIRACLPPVAGDDFYRITLTGECEAWDPDTLAFPQFPQFPHLQLRDHTVRPADLWSCIQEDSLEGIYFRMLHDALDTDRETALLAAKISRKILDGREVTLP